MSGFLAGPQPLAVLEALLHDEGVIFPPIDEGFLSFVVIGSGRHPAEMKPH